MRKWLAILSCICVLWGCDDRDKELYNGIPSAGYLPLEEGNYWDFKDINAKRSGVVLHREVRGLTRVNGREYYLVTSGSASTGSYIDSAYYRTEANGDVYLYRKGTTEEVLKFKLFAREGDTWTYPASDNDEVMNVSVHIGPVDAGSTTVDNCKNYYYNVNEWADEEHTITLAQGVGFIREYSDAWGTGMYLSKASIGGLVTQY